VVGLSYRARSASGVGVDLAKVVDSPMGRRPVGEGLSFPALDLFVHARDLARSVGKDLEVPATVIDFARAVIDPLPEDAVRNDRVFARPTPAPAGTTVEGVHRLDRS